MGGPKANELATYLAGLGARMELRTTASFAEHFPGSSTLWAEYLNGSKIIPAHVLGLVVRKLYRADERRMRQTLTRASQLHGEAAAESARPASAAGETQVAARELIAVQQHLVETTEKLAKANEVAEQTRSVIPTLLAMYARVESSVRELTTQRDSSRAVKRAETEARLDKARLRLERTERELERARQHRYTAEQAQQALLIEAEEARRDLEEARRQAADLNLGDTDGTEQRHLPARQEIDPGDDDDFADYDDALERITSEGEERERDLADITEHTGTPMPEPQDTGPQIITGTVIPTPRDPAHPDDSWPAHGADNTDNTAISGTAQPAPAPSTWASSETEYNAWGQPTREENPDQTPDPTPYNAWYGTSHDALGAVDDAPYDAGELSGTITEKASTSENTHVLAPAEEALPAFWGWFLAPPVPVLVYTVPATFIAGIQASPGAGILNLIVYTILALPALAIALMFLLGPLTSIDSDIPFISALILGILALLAGLVVPWIVGAGQPWHWIADLIGVI
ncbi:hypothetical protein ACFRK5_36195 [Streptomyces niveus]|uniref:hypothetical protein n=1 Tax=Streptomyces niveus TaxID=193462 RepID=UPI0036C14DDB